MSDLDRTISALLEQHTTPQGHPERYPDWDDVVRRASRPGWLSRWSSRSGSTRGGMLIAVAALVLGVGSALAGVGPGAALVRLVEGDRQPPKDIRDYLAGYPHAPLCYEAPCTTTFVWPRPLRVIVSQARMVLHVGGLSEWIGPTVTGRYCRGTYTRHVQMTSCIPHSFHPATSVLDDTLFPSNVDLRDGWLVRPLISGTAPLGTSRVMLEFEDGTHRDLRISTVRFPYFVFFVDSRELSARNLRIGHRPQELVAFDAAGRRVGASRFSTGEFLVCRSRDPKSYNYRHCGILTRRWLGLPPSPSP